MLVLSVFSDAKLRREIDCVSAALRDCALHFGCEKSEQCGKSMFVTVPGAFAAGVHPLGGLGHAVLHVPAVAIRGSCGFRRSSSCLVRAGLPKTRSGVTNKRARASR
jgi:hypothetical protein